MAAGPLRVEGLGFRVTWVVRSQTDEGSKRWRTQGWSGCMM